MVALLDSQHRTRLGKYDVSRDLFLANAKGRSSAPGSTICRPVYHDLSFELQKAPGERLGFGHRYGSRGSGAPSGRARKCRRCSSSRHHLHTSKLSRPFGNSSQNHRRPFDLCSNRRIVSRGQCWWKSTHSSGFRPTAFFKCAVYRGQQRSPRVVVYQLMNGKFPLVHFPISEFRSREMLRDGRNSLFRLCERMGPSWRKHGPFFQSSSRSARRQQSARGSQSRAKRKTDRVLQLQELQPHRPRRARRSRHGRRHARQ